MLLYTPTMLQLENDGLEQQLIAKSIYEYIVEQWGDAYPVIDTLISNIFDPPAFPLRGVYITTLQHQCPNYFNVNFSPPAPWM